jgi:hypothetical protein
VAGKEEGEAALGDLRRERVELIEMRRRRLLVPRVAAPPAIHGGDVSVHIFSKSSRPYSLSQ